MSAGPYNYDIAKAVMAFASKASYAAKTIYDYHLNNRNLAIRLTTDPADLRRDPDKTDVHESAKAKCECLFDLLADASVGTQLMRTLFEESNAGYYFYNAKHQNAAAARAQGQPDLTLSNIYIDEIYSLAIEVLTYAATHEKIPAFHRDPAKNYAIKKVTCALECAEESGLGGYSEDGLFRFMKLHRIGPQAPHTHMAQPRPVLENSHV